MVWMDARGLRMLPCGAPPSGPGTRALPRAAAALGSRGAPSQELSRRSACVAARARALRAAGLLGADERRAEEARVVRGPEPREGRRGEEEERGEDVLAARLGDRAAALAPIRAVHAPVAAGAEALEVVHVTQGLVEEEQEHGGLAQAGGDRGEGVDGPSEEGGRACDQRGHEANMKVGAVHVLDGREGHGDNELDDEGESDKLEHAPSLPAARGSARAGREEPERLSMGALAPLWMGPT
eukprot:CAMPEP_0206018968 /NCGR_PEP_ID=MMETSP1464-20131121/28237_1 /ASSEMBLY_ACC=CAM_ASM_001124 /TAXON_ID=119497 /ORGANISM="Exanthemachrysis gayraliae, Strain RCC1523" /LENGTH=239 /DNA_ID=CAMNT_0053392859 /DNA_START=151 /DNA_END=867 /DNA_ORIENTATION=+